MFESIEKAAAALSDKNGGWVTRRDGAEALGKAAARALEALRAHKEEKDVDVRRVVDEALGRASAALAGVAPKTEPYTLEELVRACEKSGSRTVKTCKDGYEIHVALKDGRHQTVYVRRFKRKDGAELIRVYTPCGKPTEDALAWALRANAKMVQGAVALSNHNGEEVFSLMNCHIASETTPAEIKASVKELAFYGDWMEQKLSGLDDF